MFVIILHYEDTDLVELYSENEKAKVFETYKEAFNFASNKVKGLYEIAPF